MVRRIAALPSYAPRQAARPLQHSGGTRAVLSLRDALRAAAAALCALEYVHARGAAHCDVRLESICCIPNRAPPPPRALKHTQNKKRTDAAAVQPERALVTAAPLLDIAPSEAFFFVLGPVALRQPAAEDGDSAGATLEALQAADIAAVGTVLEELLVRQHTSKALRAVLKRLRAAPTELTPSQQGRAKSLRAMTRCIFVSMGPPAKRNSLSAEKE